MPDLHCKAVLHRFGSVVDIIASLTDSLVRLSHTILGEPVGGLVGGIGATTVQSSVLVIANQFLDNLELRDMVERAMAPEAPNSGHTLRSTSAECLETSSTGSEKTAIESTGNAAVNGTMCDGMNKPGGRLKLLMKQRNRESLRRGNIERRKGAKSNGIKSQV